MAHGEELWTPSQLQHLVDKINIGVEAEETIRRMFPKAAPDELARLAEVAKAHLARFAEGGGAQARNALEAMTRWGQQAPAAAQSVARHLQTTLTRAANPQWVIGAWRDIMTSLQRSGFMQEAAAVMEEVAIAARTNPLARNLLVEIERQPSVFGALAAMAGQMLRNVLGSAASAAGTAMAGVSLSGILMGAAALGIAGYATYRLADYIGERAGDASVRGRNVQSPVQRTATAEKYGVYVGGGYNEVIVGQLSAIMGAPTATLVGWGTDRTKSVRDTGASFRMVLGPFDNAEAARQAYQDSIVPGSQRRKPAAGGTVARFKFDGQEHDIDNAMRLLR